MHKCRDLLTSRHLANSLNCHACWLVGTNSFIPLCADGTLTFISSCPLGFLWNGPRWQWPWDKPNQNSTKKKKKHAKTHQPHQQHSDPNSFERCLHVQSTHLLPVLSRLLLESNWHVLPTGKKCDSIFVLESNVTKVISPKHARTCRCYSLLADWQKWKRKLGFGKSRLFS